MSQVLEFLQLWHAVEPYKAYSREPWVMGRVRVRLLDEDGVPWNPEVPDRESFLDVGRCCLQFQLSSPPPPVLIVARAFVVLLPNLWR